MPTTRIADAEEVWVRAVVPKSRWDEMSMWRELQPGDPELIGPYRIRGLVGVGGMGRVFLGVSAGGPPRPGPGHAGTGASGASSDGRWP